jgi:hypothetical protein
MAEPTDVKTIAAVKAIDVTGDIVYLVVAVLGAIALLGGTVIQFAGLLA